MLAAASVALGAAVALAVAVLPARLALAVDPARGLAAEGMTSSLPGFASRAALATIVVLALFVTGAGVGYGVLAPAAIPTEAFVPVPTAAPPSPEALALAAHVQAIAGFPDRSPRSPGEAAAFRYIADFLAAHGGQTNEEDFVSPHAEWLDADGGHVERGGLFPIALAVTATFDPASSQSFTTATGKRPGCAPGLVMLRVAGYEEEAAAYEYLASCAASGTTAAIAVKAVEDATWRVVSSAASVRLSTGRILWATVGTATETTPLLVVPIESTGPGAAESAAPIAVALELVVQASAAGQPLRLAFADVTQRGLIAVLLRRVAEMMPGSPLIELGPLGGRLAAILGSRPPGSTDPVAVRAGLLSSVVLDKGAAAWVARTRDISDADAQSGTSDELLAALAGGSLPTDIRYEGQIDTSALPLGLDAAYLGEPIGHQTETGSPADTADQVDVSALEVALARLSQTLEDLDGR